MVSIRSINRWGRPLLHTCAISLTFCGLVVHAQVIGEEAEMGRLQARADELIANSDPEGAAMSMGRAALMAAQLAKRHGETPGGRLYRGAETLYRAEEHGYRALALFQRAGGQAPASTGVCHTAESARAGIQQAQAALTFDDQTTQQLAPKEHTRLATLRAAADDWTTVVASMQSDFQCP